MEPTDQQYQDSLREKASVFITAPNNTPATNSFLSSLASTNILQSKTDPSEVNSQLHKSLFAKLSIGENLPVKINEQVSDMLEDIGTRYNDLPENLYRRLRALRKLERSRIEHEISYLTKLQSITETYNAKMQSYFEVRTHLLNSDCEVAEGDMCPNLREEEVPEDHKMVRFPDFWVHVFADSGYFDEDDFEFLTYVEDINGHREYPERDVLVRAVEARRQLFESGQTDNPNLKPEDLFSKTIIRIRMGENPFIPSGVHSVTAYTDPFTNQVRDIKSDIKECYPAFSPESPFYHLLCPPNRESDDMEATEIREQLFDFMNEILQTANNAILEYTGEGLIEIQQA